MALINAPLHELDRSYAARAVARMAHTSDLMLAHFEHRHHLPVPEHWHAPDRLDLRHDPASSPGWQGGVLKESKYSHFRLDGPIGSFNPGHRAKWTTHELCHRLVGFGWSPSGSLLFNALAARLSEVLPVALYYFFDEAGLRRCPEHAGGGPLFGDFCAACEHAAEQGPLEEDPDAERWLEAGQAFVHRELEAVARSVELGRPLPHRYATLDLASDGVAYARAHHVRLTSPEFAEFMTCFYRPNQGWFDHLDDLSERVLQVMGALCGGPDASPLDGDRWLWAAQDLGWRLYQIKAETRGPLLADLDAVLSDLASTPTAEGIVACEARYAELADEWYLPPAQDVFAVGYPLPEHHGRSASALAEGLGSVCPNTLAALGESSDALVEAFTEADVETRRPLAHRFADFLAEHHDGPVSHLARFEATVTHPPQLDLTEASLPPTSEGTWRKNPSVVVLRAPVNVIAFAESPETSPEPDPSAVVIGRRPDGDLTLAEIPRAWADDLEALTDTDLVLSDLDPDAAEALIALQVIRPQRWALVDDPLGVD
ncbi:MAG: hypothetical protein ACE366_05500 [Bradymonadia bacterium]